MKLMKFISFFGYGLLAISLIIIISFLATSNLQTQEFPQIDLVMNWTYIMLGLSIAVALLLPFVNIVGNPKGMIRSLVGVGGVAVVLLICYFMADTTPVTLASKDVIDDETSLLVSDTGLYATYFAFAAAIIAIVAGEIFNAIKK